MANSILKPIFLIIALFSCSIYAQVKPIDQQLLDTALASYYAVNHHNETGCLNLFAPNATVEEPVGTSALIGKSDLEGFWNVFIAPSEVSMINLMSFASEETFEVVRYVNVTVAFPDDKVSINQRAILLYQIDRADPVMKMKSLQAYWNLMDRIKEIIFQRGGILNLMKMSYRLLSNFGISGVFRYMKGFMGVGSGGIEWSRNFYNAIVTNNFNTYKTLLSGTAFKKLTLIFSNRRVIYDASDSSKNYFWKENIEEHRMDNITIDQNSFLYSGYNVAGAFKINWNNKVINAIFIHSFDSHQIETIRIWIDSIKY